MLAGHSFFDTLQSPDLFGQLFHSFFQHAPTCISELQAPDRQSKLLNQLILLGQFLGQPLQRSPLLVGLLLHPPGVIRYLPSQLTVLRLQFFVAHPQAEDFFMECGRSVGIFRFGSLWKTLRVGPKGRLGHAQVVGVAFLARHWPQFLCPLHLLFGRGQEPLSLSTLLISHAVIFGSHFRPYGLECVPQSACFEGEPEGEQGRATGKRHS